MKLIAEDNYGRDHVSDRLICPNITKAQGSLIIKELKDVLPYDDWSYKLVSDNHKLYGYIP